MNIGVIIKRLIEGKILTKRAEISIKAMNIGGIMKGLIEGKI